MNDSSILDLQQLNRDANLNTLMYLREYFGDTYDGMLVSELIGNTKDNLERAINLQMKEGKPDDVEKLFSDKLRQIKVLENAISNDPGMGDLVVSNISWEEPLTDPETGLMYEREGLYACTFQDSLKNPSSVTVVYRGTAAREWLDNGFGLSGVTGGTDQQNQATNYFNDIVRRNGWDYSKPEVVVTGHSKGGNKAQYVVMTSMYADLIVNGYSLDGQSMSPEEMLYLKDTLGEEEYEHRRQKLYSISSDNDYVNVLGVNSKNGRLVPEDHIFFMESNLKGVEWHFADCFLNEDGTLTSFTEQGEVSKFVQNLSEHVMELPSPLRGIVTNGAMGLAQVFRGYPPANGEHISYTYVGGAVAMLLEMLPGAIVEFCVEKLGVNHDWLFYFVTAVTVVFSHIITPLALTTLALGTFIDLVVWAIDKLKVCGEKIKELTTRAVDFFQKTIAAMREWFGQTFSKAYQYATDNPLIKIDTDNLSFYAERINSINSRIDCLDRRLNSLYWKVGFLDLWNLLQADLLTSYSFRLKRCETYLSDTAKTFNKAEDRIKYFFS